MDERDTIEGLLDFKDEEIKQLYQNWDKGDCSLVGLTEIYLYQCIKKHKQENGEYYDTDYDQIKLRHGTNVGVVPRFSGEEIEEDYDLQDCPNCGSGAVGYDGAGSVPFLECFQCDHNWIP